MDDQKIKESIVIKFSGNIKPFNYSKIVKGTSTENLYETAKIFAFLQSATMSSINKVITEQVI